MPQQAQPKPPQIPSDAPTHPNLHDPELQNEGEGSRSAARRYDRGAEKAAQDPQRVDKLAHEAEEALEGEEGDELRKADERGKNAQHH